MAGKIKQIGKLFWVIITVVPILGMIWGIISPGDFDTLKVYWQNKIAFLGAWSAVIFVLLQAAQVIITPISHYAVGALGGFLFGPFFGGALNYVGRLIGHISCYWIAFFARNKAVSKFVKPEVLEKYDSIVKEGKYKSYILFLIYFLPFFPDDEISYLVGLSKMKFSLFLAANIFGHLGGSFSLAYIGSGLDTKDPWFWFLFSITILGFPILYWLSKTNQKIATNSDDKK